MSIAPIRHVVMTKAAPARAFALFTSRMHAWWPPGRTIGTAPHVAIVLEPWPGGRWFERDAAGVETEWGEVVAWEPPARVLLAWRIDGGFRFDPAVYTEVEVGFAAAGPGGTRVTLEHRRLEGLGSEAGRIRGLLDGGWPTRLRDFAGYADAEVAA